MGISELDDMAVTLRSSLSSTELVLAKFSESFRREVVSTASKSATPNLTTTALLIDIAGKMQADFAKFKASMDVLLAFFPLSKQTLPELSKLWVFFYEPLQSQHIIVQ